ncbi:very short patch repair endonuclease [Candidatus Peregrinibacteria bacterium]|nr:very short patch repair endonuclease [Candidatus Peregrinibacteria bacterium]
MDTLSKHQRSQLMSRIRSKNTKPELIFRRTIWAKGIRGYRLHKKLPGKPDLYFGPQKVAVFIDGCFWHQCPRCYRAPKTHKRFWTAKIKRNIARDLENDVALRTLGIKPLRFWEHDVNDSMEKCHRTLRQFIR